MSESEPPSSASSRSITPDIVVSPPTPGEELDWPAAVSGIAIQQPAPEIEQASKDEAIVRRKHTNMGWPGHDFTYISLSKDKAKAELERLAAATVSHRGTLHAVTFQPHPDPEKHTQDRYTAETWDLDDHRGIWKFRAVFDGHAAGDETVDYVFSTLPAKIKAALAGIPLSQLDDVDVVSTMLRNTISSMDETIKQDVLQLFPSAEFIEKLSDDEIRRIVNDSSTSDVGQVQADVDVVVPSSTGSTTLSKKYAGRGQNNIKVTRAMRGTTVLVTLISPDGGLWTASLGDCQAILGQKSSAEKSSSGKWTATLLSANHNASEPSEITRVKLEHPGEEEAVITKSRVLGLIAVTRAIGDLQFKLPSIYTKRIFSLTVPGMNRPQNNFDMMIERNKTPPYVGGIPEVGYVKRDKGAKTCLIMCSDGLMDLYGGEDWQEKHITVTDVSRDLVELVGMKLDSDPSSSPSDANLALFLLHRGLRGPPRSKLGRSWTDQDSSERMSSFLTLEYKDKWMDDTTVLVEIL